MTKLGFFIDKSDLPIHYHNPVEVWSNNVYADMMQYRNWFVVED